MDWGLVGEGDVPFRTSLALIARALRRVLPLAADEHPDFGLPIGVMESIAADEHLDMAEVKDAVSHVQALGGVPGLIAGFALSTALVDTSPTPPDSEHEGLTIQASEVIHLALQIGDEAGDDGLGRRAWKTDLGRARKVLDGTRDRHPRTKPLGIPMEPGPQGPLGALWPDGRVPPWFIEAVRKTAPVPFVLPGELFAADPERYIEHAEAVCWHFDHRTRPEDFHRMLDAIKEGLAKAGDLPSPVFVVHAPGVEPRWLEEASQTGATLLLAEAVGPLRPTTSSELAEAVGYTMLEEQLGWQETGLDYVSRDPRTLWRLSSEERGRLIERIPHWKPHPGEPVLGGPEGQMGIQGVERLVPDPSSAKDFESLISDNRSASERLGSEEGWPSDLPDV
jgi:hypothetical protein